jgi:hypothetical protein
MSLQNNQTTLHANGAIGRVMQISSDLINMFSKYLVDDLRIRHPGQAFTAQVGYAG